MLHTTINVISMMTTFSVKMTDCFVSYTSLINFNLFIFLFFNLVIFFSNNLDIKSGSIVTGHQDKPKKENVIVH